jgi:hypothetical protein
MMGQQETVASSALKRMILVLTVAAVMAALMLASVMPAFAKGPPKGPPLEHREAPCTTALSHHSLPFAC